MGKAKKSNAKKVTETRKSNSFQVKDIKKAGAAAAASGSKHKKRSIEAVDNNQDDNEYEDLGMVDDWDWNEVTTPSNMFMGDDSTGFLCLEEISDVEVDYEGDDTIGKLVKFKRKKKADRKSGRKAQPMKPLEDIDMGDFYDVDTFSEEALLAQKRQGSTVETESVVENVAQDDMETADDTTTVDATATIELAAASDDDDDDDDDDNMDQETVAPTPATTSTATKEKGKASLNGKELTKKQRIVEKLKTRIQKQETEDAAADATKLDEKEKVKRRQLLKKLRSLQKKLESEIETALAQREAKNKPKAVAETAKGSEAKSSNTFVRPNVEDVDQSIDISAWGQLDLCEPIVNALKYYKFCEPTLVQTRSLPKALEGRDIIGVAETGSGKTLAFGIPIVDAILKRKEQIKGLTGLILAPTRELAIQVKDHIRNIAVFGHVNVVAIVGGMSIQKQQRQLKDVPDIIVATPGRLWELLSTNQTYMDMLKDIKFLVLDEADRMLEKGHFEELSNLLRELSTKLQNTSEWPEEVDGGQKKIIERDVGVHQTFIFTATMDKDIIFNVKSKKTPAKSKGTLADLVRRIEFADKNPVLVDVTSEKRVASRLVEAKVDCLKTEKDLYVYYLVTRYPGRTIIFVNSIDAIRRLVPIFRLLGVEVLGLHAQMQQKQRLKNLDRFKENSKAVLVASDVAARGLDIPLVEHVIHYQLPRSGEIYVHRSGRTARANRDGISLLLCGPDEMKVYRKLVQTLRKGEKYPDFPIDLGILRAMKKRVQLATEIDKLEHQENKVTHDDNWMRNMAKEMDMEFDEDMVKGNNNSREETEHQFEKDRAKVRSLRYELKDLLKTPMLPDGASTRYLTGSAISGLMDRLLENEADPTMLPAHGSSKAVDDAKSFKKRKLQ
ncbi:P-loop containing nucleoside triphosphate hydrolase protein [Absidia repens]|uniref:RNA helicase n=1 Tax=Absidia repens TaxID=90262 RepID=A0A1X2IJ01_9FUNG|nr:P-loop containing nucleoside triphosphate hydrolase protein [Absidia repens]